MRALPSFLRKQLETSVLAARRAAEAASRAAIESLGVFADRRPEHLDADAGGPPQWASREVAPVGQRPRPARRGVRVRAVAPAAVRAVPRRERPAAPPAVPRAGDARRVRGARRRSGRARRVVRRRTLRGGDPPGDLPPRRPVRPAAPRARRTPRTGADPRRHPRRDVHCGRRAGLGVPVLAEGQEGRGQRLGAQDRRRRPRAGDPAVHRELHGPVPARELPRRVVGRPASRQPAREGLRVPPLRRRRQARRRRRSTAGRTASPRSRSWTRAAGRVTSSSRRSRCSGRCAPRRKASHPSKRRTRCCATTSSVSSSILAVCRSRMFAVALQAWKAGRGWRQLPVPNIACSGIPVKAPVEEWKALASGDQRARTCARSTAHALPRRRHTGQPDRPTTSGRCDTWSDVLR